MFQILLFCLAALSANASPLESRNRKVPLAKKDSCAVTTYTIITPSPGAIPTPVTAQFQPVVTYIAEYIVCNVATPTKCNTVYSTSSFKWLSTAVPCYNGLCTITDVSQFVTVTASPSYAIATATCQSSGQCYYGDKTTYVSTSTAFPYVAAIDNYYVSPFSSYFDFYFGSSNGVGSLNLDIHSCSNGVCAVSPINVVHVVNVVTNYLTYPVIINTFIPANTIININGGVTININNAPTSIATTVLATSTIVSTETLTSTEQVTK